MAIVRSARRATQITVLALSLAVPLAAVAAGGHGQSHGMHGMHAMHRALDLDGNGEVTREEASQARHDRLAAIDANADGAVSFEEMQAFRASERERRQRERFARLDTDNDGVVSVNELAAVADKRFERMDRDGNGVISRDEMRMNHPHRRMRHRAD